MKILAVAEKPSVAKSVAAILGGNNVRRRGSGATYISNWDFSYKINANGGAFVDFTVTSVAGHLKSQDFTDAHRKWHTCDPFVLFDAPIQTFVADNMKPIQRNLENEIRNATELMIWTDCDREGEHIGSEIVSVCRKIKPNIRITRARFSALIPAQIHNAARNTVPLDMNQAAAVEARMELDLRTGAAMTRLQTLSMQTQFQGIIEGVVSYGSCQFPTLGFVVERYTEVQSFVPEPFWYIHVALEREESKVSFSWKRNRLFDNDAAFVLFEQCVEAPEATVLTVTNKPTQKWKPWPLTTVELQKCGSRLLRLPPQTVLQIAEKLYQGGFVSYPRTETDQYDPAFNFHELIQRQRDAPAWGAFARMLLDEGGYERPKNGRKNDKAHPPIHPVNYAGNLTGDDKRVYEFIVRRFLANCSRNAIGAETVVEVDIAGELFTAKGLVVHARNYLDVYPYDKWNAHQLPNFRQGEKFMPDVCELKEGQTTSPNLLTEADLVNLMDKNGIGTDATIAEHIAKIIEREYVMRQREGRIDYLLPSTLGIGLVEGYNRIGFDKSLCKPHLRAETEQRMEAICAGQMTKNEVVQQTCDEYRDLFIRTRQNMNVLINAVREFIEGNGGEAGPPPAVQGHNGPNEDGEDDDYDDGHDGGNDHNPGGGRPGRGNGPRGGRGAANNQPTRGSARTRARGGNAGQPQGRRPPRRDDDDDDDTENRRPQSGRGQQRGDGDTPSCQCDEPAVEKTTRKEGPNLNRRFWGCAKPFGNGACSFFEWLDPPGDHAGGSGQNNNANAGKSRKRGAAEVVGGVCIGDIPTCQCKLEARACIAQKEPHNGRSFYACPKPREEQCRFFQWADDTAVPMRSVPAVRGVEYSGANTGGAAQVCYSCQQPGHFSNACPNKQGGGPGYDNGNRGDQVCYKCQQLGHFASSCPNRENTGGNAQAGSSRYSRESGHFDGGNSGNGSGGCFNCGESGHWANACTAPKSYQPRNDNAQAGPSNYTCFKCNVEGHMSRDCPNDGQAAPSSRGRPSKRARGTTRKTSGGAREGGRGSRGSRGSTRARGRGKGRAAAARTQQQDDDFGNDYDEYDNEY